LRGIGAALVVAAIAGAPLAAGGVHRIPLIVLMSAIALGFLTLAAGLGSSRRALRIGAAVALPLGLLLVPVLQSIPIPMGLRAHLDPRGSELLQEDDLATVKAWPLSLDPPVTRVHVGQAAAAVAAFVVAFHLASSQTKRHLVPRVVAASGIAAVAIGLGHRILGLSQLYGLVDAPGRALLAGPFVNSNHTSEFLELTTFVCLACSFHRPTALNRIGWLVGAALCGGGALATLSRGSVGALASGLLVFGLVRYAGRDRQQVSRRGRALWVFVPLGLIVIGAAALGADRLVERFKSSSISSDIRFQLWREGLHVLAAHPLGIGRGAFERVFPIYRTLKTPFALRFSFLENEPLQLLVDSGWVLFVPIVAGAVIAGWTIARHGRRDRVEAAFLGGLTAVLAHSLVDFGFETLGVALPFMAILGVTVGRLPMSDSARPPVRSGWIIAALASVGLMAGVAATAHASNDDMDALLKKALTPENKRALLVRAQQTHPVDYFYALSFAQIEPLKAGPGTPSPRLHALNRALRLCGACETVHAEVATNLWRLGLRAQSLLEWRTAVELQPTLLHPVMGRLFAAGAKPAELAALGAFDPARMTEIADFLSSVSRIPDAFVVLDQADAMGAPRSQTLLVRGRLQMQTGDLAGTTRTIAAARALAVQDPRLEILEAQVLVAADGAKAADRSLAILDSAAARYPADLPVARERVALVLRFEKWQAASRAVDGLKRALHETQQQLSEAHAIDARIQTRLGRLTAALGEYRIALAEDWRNVALWIEMGETAERAGRSTTAAEAFREACRLSPNNPEAQSALRRIEGHDRGGLVGPSSADPGR
jgi:tetratricopeptide (TPR) repeat protein